MEFNEFADEVAEHWMTHDDAIDDPDGLEAIRSCTTVEELINLMTSFGFKEIEAYEFLLNVALKVGQRDKTGG